jgi:triosephosphate isomerase
LGIFPAFWNLTMRKLIAGNWKMNGSRDSAIALIEAVRNAVIHPRCDILVCPSFVHLSLAADRLANAAIMIGAQDCHAKPPGAHTGDVSATMVRDAGATWVIVGHSERRQLHGETDELVRAKTVAAQDAGLQTIVAIGETGADHCAGRTEQVLAAQLAGSLPDDFQGVVAYEPIWAIGTGKTPDVQTVEATMAFIRATIADRFPKTGAATRLLYGGSVTPDNARDLLALPGVDGALSGGASLHADQFLRIIAAADSLA